ncbi:hypothetical protein FALCPG4_015889 [Fusarium falciforme]
MQQMPYSWPYYGLKGLSAEVQGVAHTSSTGPKLGSAVRRSKANSSSGFNWYNEQRFGGVASTNV